LTSKENIISYPLSESGIRENITTMTLYSARPEAELNTESEFWFWLV